MERTGANLCLNPNEQTKVADGIKKLEICRLVSLDQQKAIDGLQATVDADKSWWMQPQLIIGGYVLSFSVGALVAVSLLKH